METLKDWIAGLWLGSLVLTCTGGVLYTLWCVLHDVFGLTWFQLGFLAAVVAVFLAFGASIQWSMKRLGLE